MLRLMTTLRRDGKALQAYLPYDIKHFHGFSQRKDIPAYKKLLILAEQFILAKSVDDMMQQGSEDLGVFLTTIKNEAHMGLPTMQDDIDQFTYTQYKSGVQALMRYFRITPSLEQMFEDTIHYTNEDRILPGTFVKPFLDITKNEYRKVQHIYKSATILYPERVDDVLVFHPYTSSCVAQKHLVENSANPQMQYLLHFNWNNTNWMKLLGIVGSFCVDSVAPQTSNRSVSHFLRAAAEQKTSNIVNYSEIRSRIFTMLRDGVSSFDATPCVEEMQYLLKQLNYDDTLIKALENPEPTEMDVMSFLPHNELGFLKDMLVRRGMEAAEDDDPFSEANSADDDPFADMGDAGGGNDPFAGDAGDSMDDPFGDMGSSDTGDSFGSSGGTDAEPKKNVEEVPSDPFSLKLNIVTSETFDDYLMRNEAISIINAVIMDPPASLGSENLRLLKIWVTQWINFYPVEVTKELLSKLAIYYNQPTAA